MRTLSQLVILASSIALLTGLPTFADGQLICGGTIGAGKHQMTADIINCAGTPALTLESGAELDMNGHRITCLDNSRDGVLLSGAGSAIANGTISGCNIGLEISGGGGHEVSFLVLIDNGNVGLHTLSDGNKLSSIYADDNATSQIYIESDGNKLSRCHGSGGNRGIHIQGDKNKVSDSSVRENAIHGFYVEDGNGNSFKGCAAVGVDIDGFHVRGEANKITGSSAIYCDEHGFSLEGAGNKVVKSTAIGNEYGFSTGAGCESCTFSNNNSTDNFTANFSGGGERAVFAKNDAKGGDIGILLDNPGATARSNRVIAANDDGIQVFDAPFVISDNIVFGSIYDLHDETAMCTGNVWQDNLAGTTFQGCED
ncbi:MAG TPA: right-handed parallel beta-helix repeat-containing protein [Terriglobales bacterium]|nr:right-handed parallel beta-helix repeat-containing protein [Terriglobales bacterium]